MKITLRLYNRKNKLLKRIMTNRSKWRKLYAKLASAAAHKYFLRVDYGYSKNVWGKRVLFKNEGIYFSKEEAKNALKAFIEE